jgi:acyl-CoA synthetase (AMP-forming)/AMP-acid ligase II
MPPVIFISTADRREMINVGGMKFFPQEVEGCWVHPAVKEVCVRATHDRFGEVSYAQVVIDAGPKRSVSEKA